MTHGFIYDAAIYGELRLCISKANPWYKEGAQHITLRLIGIHLTAAALHAQSMTRPLSTLQLPLNTNCLAFCPSSESSWLAAGCYQLSACRTARQGGLHILLIAGSSEEGLDVTEVCSDSFPGRGSKDATCTLDYV